MPQFDAFEQEAARLLEQYQVPGCVVAVAKHGRPVYEQTFGYRDRAEKKQIDRDTVFGLASLTKSFTCAAIMKLVEAEKVSLLDPVVTYLPELQIKNKDKLHKMTIAHFMTHSSGLPPLPSIDLAMVRKKNKVWSPDYGENPPEEQQLLTYEELITFINEQLIDPISTPGALFSYSNDAYALLGTVIERVTGCTYEEYVMKEIIQPCGMEHTHFLLEEYGDYDNVSACYEIKEDTGEIYAVEDFWDAPSMRATGFLKSTVRDMMRYAMLYINEGRVDGKSILSPESIREMLHPHIKMDPEKMYGFGWSVTEDYHGSLMIDHGGSLQSISSKFAILPEQGISVIVLTNLSDFPAGRLLLMALNAYFGRDLDADHLGFKRMELPEKTLTAYAGSYESDEGMDCILRMTPSGKPQFFYRGIEYPVTFVAENVCTALIDDIEEPVEFLKDEHGGVFALSIYHRILPKVNNR